MAGGRLSKLFGGKWSADLTSDLGVPMFSNGGSGSGTSYLWDAGAQVNCRLSALWTATAGYNLEQVRYSIESTQDLGSANGGSQDVISSASYTQHQFKIGITYAW